MLEITLCMIVRDEEEVLEQCLSSVASICDEIIIVDTGSIDRTKEIAGNFTKDVYEFEWVDDFSAARNYAFDQATKDFILWLDADDVLLEEDQKKLIALKKTLTEEIDAVSMLYHIAFDARDNPTFSFRRNRLVKRSNTFQWKGAVHEFLDVRGHIVSSDIAVTHRKNHKTKSLGPSDRNLRIYENRLKKGEEFSPRDLFYYANELKDHGNLLDAINFYNQFLRTNKGWVEDRIRACLYQADCYRQMDSPDKEMGALVTSFLYDVPRPEASCRMGDLYKKKKQWEQAIIWYTLALDIPVTNDSGFTLKQFSTSYPHLQLCVCYWQVRAYEKALEHHKKAKSFLPDDPRVVYNESFFEKHMPSVTKGNE